MYVVLVKFSVKPEFADAFRALVLLQAETSLSEERACRRFDVAFEPEDSTKCLLYELYDDRAAFESHLKTAHFAEFDAAVAGGLVSKKVSCWQLATSE